MNRSESSTTAIKKAKRLIAPSNYVKKYMETQLDRSATVYYPDVFGTPPFKTLGKFTNPFVTMVNPCAWKGSSIFLKIAAALPNQKFAAVPTWGATPSVITALKNQPNVTLLPKNPNIDEILNQTSVLLAPSLCQEAFGLISTEALLRGVPVIASDIAGLKESTLGAGVRIPVEPLSFENPPTGDDPSELIWPEPPNPAEPWCEALATILANEDAYADFATAGKSRAEAFVNGLANRNLLQLFLE